MIDAAVLKLDLYKPRTSRKNKYYRLVEAHHEKLEGVWEERYQSKYGFWRPYVKNVIYRYNMINAEQLCDRVAFIVDGVIPVIDSPKELKVKHGSK